MTGKPEMPRTTSEAVARALGTAPILWAGKPRPRAEFLLWLPIWFVAIPWIGVSLSPLLPALEPSVSTGQTQLGRLGTAVAFLFVVGGVLMLLTPFSFWRSARSVVYALTPDRLWQLDVTSKNSAVAYELARVLRTERTEHADGWGTLTLSLGSRDSNGVTHETQKVILRAIPEVRRLEQLIRSHSDALRH